MGYVYLLHFSHPIGNLKNPKGTAQHYLGYTSRSLKKRLEEHQKGVGAKITRAVVQDYKYKLQLVRHWSKCNRELEKQLKQRHNSVSLCPLCKPRKTNYKNLKINPNVMCFALKKVNK